MLRDFQVELVGDAGGHRRSGGGCFILCHNGCFVLRVVFDFRFSLSFHQQHNDHAPGDEQHVAHGVGDGVAQRRHLALRFVLNGAQRRRRRARAGAAAEHDARVHLEKVFAGENANDKRQGGDKHTPQEQAQSGFLQARHGISARW